MAAAQTLKTENSFIHKKNTKSIFKEGWLFAIFFSHFGAVTIQSMQKQGSHQLFLAPSLLN